MWVLSCATVALAVQDWELELFASYLEPKRVRVADLSALAEGEAPREEPLF